MSGGAFSYLDSQLKSELFGWSYDNDKWSGRNIFEDREISEIVFDVLSLIHEYDWYYSGDNSEERYLEAKEKFKNKWLKKPRVRVQHVIDTAVEDLRQELYKTYGVDKDE